MKLSQEINIAGDYTCSSIFNNCLTRKAKNKSMIYFLTSLLVA